MLARLLGREKSGSVAVWLVVVAVGLRLGRGPKERRDTPEVLRRGTCLLVLEEKLARESDGAWREWEGVVVSEPARLAALEEAVEPTARLRLRIVTVGGTAIPRGEERGGVLVDPVAGSLERADWTRASSRCICAVRVRMWVRELEGGIL